MLRCSYDLNIAWSKAAQELSIIKLAENIKLFKQQQYSRECLQKTMIVQSTHLFS